MAKKINYKEMFTEEQIEEKINEHMNMLMSMNVPRGCSKESIPEAIELTEVIKFYQEVLKEIRA